MTMPTFTCPVCRNILTIETVFAHDGIRDAIQALVDVCPELLRPMIAYVGLFAPAKSVMQYKRIATLLREITEHVLSASMTLNGRSYVAPREYWERAMDEMLTRRDAGGLRLPLSSHIYLYRIVAGYCEKAESAAETHQEKQRAGHAGVGANPSRKPVKTPPAIANPEGMPAHIREQLHQMVGKTVTTQGEPYGNEQSQNQESS